MASQEDSAARHLELNNLPLELRDLIWGFTLPHRRVFHVKRLSKQKSSDNSTNSQMCFHFHLRHPPPMALSICRESRALASREGFFLSSNGDDPGIWFRPESDILYFDRNQRTMLHTKSGQPHLTIHGWDRVLNVGIEWRAFFRDVPRPSSDETMGGYWRAAIESLYAYMPSMQTLNFILPELRHKGGMVWGREPFEAGKYKASLMPLPEIVKIPWETTRNRGRDLVAMLSRFPININGQTRVVTPPMMTWGEVKSDIEQGLEEDSDQEHVASYPPEVIGWWLIRDGIPDMHANPQIQRFDS
ncbi:hypothetical protein ACHAQD_009154 [Fusarium lateritium]